eukprot:COSAG06_NODE_4520_length_4185_cov_13.400147_5_plen_73_part_00
MRCVPARQRAAPFGRPAWLAASARLFCRVVFGVSACARYPRCPSGAGGSAARTQLVPHSALSLKRLRGKIGR